MKAIVLYLIAHLYIQVHQLFSILFQVFFQLEVHSLQILIILNNKNKTLGGTNRIKISKVIIIFNLHLYLKNSKLIILKLANLRKEKENKIVLNKRLMLIKKLKST
jgi:hypothetical protein